MTKRQRAGLVISHSSLIRHSDFGFRHSPKEAVMIPSIRRLCAVALLAGALPLHAAAQEKTDKSKFELTAEEQTLIDLTNQERKKEKLPALRPNETLVKVARAHSANMARQGKMEHVLDGKTPMQRIKASGYQAAWGGENI